MKSNLNEKSGVFPLQFPTLRQTITGVSALASGIFAGIAVAADERISVFKGVPQHLKERRYGRAILQMAGNQISIVKTGVKSITVGASTTISLLALTGGNNHGKK